MCESELDRLYKEEMLTILCVHGRLSLHPHVLTDVCAGLQAQASQLYLPVSESIHLISTLRQAQASRMELCASRQPAHPHQYLTVSTALSSRHRGPQSCSPALGRLLCVCPTSLRPAALPLGSVHNDRRGHGAPRWPQFLRELTEGPPQSLDPPPPARAPPSASITCSTQKGAGSPSGPTCQGPTPGEVWA